MAVLSCLLVIFALETVYGQGPQTAAPDLFEEITGVRDTLGEADTIVVRSRVVRVSFDPLHGLRELDGGVVVLNLFEDIQFTAEFDHSRNGTHGRLTWFGTLQGVPYSTVALTVGDSIVIGTVRAPGIGSYRIGSLQEGIHVIREIDETRFPPCGVGILPEDPGNRQLPPDSLPKTLGDDGSVIDVLVVYSWLAALHAGIIWHYGGILATIDLAVAETNEGYDNSNVAPDLRLAGTAQVNYVGSGDFQVDLDRLADPADGFMDEVHAIRDAVGADVVSLILATGDFCGMARGNYDLGRLTEDRAFSIARLDCATGYYTFGHEIGHNQGCAHDRDNVRPGDGLYDYSFGHRWFGSRPQPFPILWRSVMAYSPGTRVNHYSNPNVIHDGQPTGVPVGTPNAEAHNALTINNTALTVANFRPSKIDVIWVDFTHTGTEDGSFDLPFNTVTEGVNAVQPGGTLVFKAGTTHETPTVNKAVTFISYQGIATIGRQ